MPEIVLIMTDLPAPLSRANAVTWPAGISRSTSVSAFTGPKCLLTPRRRRSGTSSSSAGPVGAVPWVAVVMLSVASSRCSMTRIRGWVASRDPTTSRALLLDSCCRARARCRACTQGGHLDGTVLDYCRGHVGRGDPERRRVDGLYGLFEHRVHGRRVGQCRRRRRTRPQEQGQRCGCLCLKVDRLVDRPALVAREDVLQTWQRGVLTGGRELLGRDVVLLEYRDDGVGVVVVGRDDRVDVRVSRVLLLERCCGYRRGPGTGRLADLHIGAGSELRVNDAVVSVREEGRVVVRRVAVHDQDVRLGDVPGRDTGHLTRADQGADLGVVAADVVPVGRSTLGQTVVVDDLHTGGFGLRLDRGTAAGVERVHQQDGGTGVDV